MGNVAATQATTVNAALGFFVRIAFTVNSTRSLLGAAAEMDIGGRKMAPFASGVIDSFQYFGAAIATKGLGWILDYEGWGWYFPYLVPFGLLAGIGMYSISHLKSLKKGAAHGWRRGRAADATEAVPRGKRRRSRTGRDRASAAYAIS